MLVILSLLALLSDWVCFSLGASPLFHRSIAHGFIINRLFVTLLPAAAPVPGATEEEFAGLHPAHLITIFLSTNVIFCFIEPLVVRRRGLRDTVVAGAALMTFGCLLRSGIGREHEVTSVSAVILGTVFVGAAQPFFQCTPAMLAAEWFGANERTVATTIAINANQIGIALSYLCGAYLVHDGPGLHKYFRLLSCFAVTLFVAALVFFRDHPPTPASASSGEKVFSPSNSKGKDRIARVISSTDHERGDTGDIYDSEEEAPREDPSLPSFIPLAVARMARGVLWREVVQLIRELRQLLFTNGFAHATEAFVVSSECSVKSSYYSPHKYKIAPPPFSLVL